MRQRELSGDTILTVTRELSGTGVETESFDLDVEIEWTYDIEDEEFSITTAVLKDTAYTIQLSKDEITRLEEKLNDGDEFNPKQYEFDC